MITFAVPWLFWASVAASLVVTGWHLLSVRQPRELLFPTARFVPPTTAKAVARQPRPSDLVLLALRVLTLLCVGLALSGARCYGDRSRHAHLVLVDQSLSDSAVAPDSLRLFGAAGDTSVHWRRVANIAADPGVGIVRAFRELPGVLRDLPRVETLDLTVIAPPSIEERRVWDAWRSRWPGHVTLVSPGRAPDVDSIRSLRPVLEFAGATRDDPILAAMQLVFPLAANEGLVSRTVRVERRDSAVASGEGTVRVHWPVSGIPTGWMRVLRADTAGAVSARGVTLVGPFVRSASAPELSENAETSWQAIAWWNDGAPAARARRLREPAGACEVQVAVVVPSGSDLLLSPHARGLLDAVAHACEVSTSPTASLVNAAVDTSSASRPADVRTLRRIMDSKAPPARSVWTLVLLAVAAGALLLEWRLRT